MHVINPVAIAFCIFATLWRPDFVASGVAAQPATNDALHQRAIEQLQTALNEEKEFVKVHAAEALVGLGYDKDVLRVFVEEEKTHGKEPHYRIGIWRVLVRSTKDPAVREKYIERILS